MLAYSSPHKERCKLSQNRTSTAMHRPTYILDRTAPSLGSTARPRVMPSPFFLPYSPRTHTQPSVSRDLEQKAPTSYSIEDILRKPSNRSPPPSQPVQFPALMLPPSRRYDFGQTPRMLWPELARAQWRDRLPGSYEAHSLFAHFLWSKLQASRGL